MERETLFSLFQRAIEDEDKAYAFYLEAAASTSEPEIKQTFEELAKTELFHSEILKNKYKKLRELTSEKQ